MILLVLLGFAFWRLGPFVLRGAAGGRRERGLVEASVAALEVKVSRGHAQVASLDLRALAAATTPATLLLARAVRYAQVANRALDVLHGCGYRVYRGVASSGALGCRAVSWCLPVQCLHRLRARWLALRTVCKLLLLAGGNLSLPRLWRDANSRCLLGV